MSYAVMPLSDYKAACDKVREKVDLTTVKFEETDFGFLRSEVFTVSKNSVYIFSYEFSDSSKFSDLYYASPEWEGETPPGYFEPIDSNSAETTSELYAGVQYRIFIADSLGLTPKDILKASLLLDEETVVDFVPPPKIKSGELADKVDEVYEAGEQAEYDHFWDALQQNGTRKDYYAFFAGWGVEEFKPKYDITAHSNFSLFYNSKITVIPKLIMFAGGQNVFAYAAKLTTIESLVLNAPESARTFDGSSFTGVTALKHINQITGTIRQHLTMSTCPLSVDSMKNIINALADYSGTSNEDAYALTVSSTCWANLEASGLSPIGDTWQNYVISKGWRIG